MEHIFKAKVMWAHLDANMHMRHSAYADFAAQARIDLLESIGLTLRVFSENKIGPILFREETKYLREVHLNEQLTIKSELTKSTKDGSRWSIRHELVKEDGIKAAVIEVDGAWIDTQKRKLTTLPELFMEGFQHLPLSTDYQEI